MRFMTPRIDTEDLVDATEVAQILSLAHRNSVSTYQRRYTDMPKPVVDFGKSRCQLWRRSQIRAWAVKRSRRESDKK
jgi:hypothetical protein